MDSLVAANVIHRPVRTLVSIAGIALGICLVMLFTGLARGLSEELQRRSSNLKAEIIFTRPGSFDMTSSNANLNTRYAQELMKVAGVQSAIPDIRYVFQGSGGFGFEQAEGVDWAPFASMNEIKLVAGRAPEAPGEIVIDHSKSENDHLKPGDRLQLFGTGPYLITGIYSPDSGPRVKMSLSAMQQALEVPGKCTWILVKCRNPEEQVEVARRIAAALPGNKIQFTRDVFTSVEKSIPFLAVFLRTLVGLSAFVSSLVVMLAMYTTITERTREIGILKALGASRAAIVWVIEKEALLISFAGLVTGFTVSLAAGYLIQKAYGLTFEYSWGWALAAAAIALAGAAAGALYPAFKAASIDAVTALAYE